MAVEPYLLVNPRVERITLCQGLSQKGPFTKQTPQGAGQPEAAADVVLLPLEEGPLPSMVAALANRFHAASNHTAPA